MTSQTDLTDEQLELLEHAFLGKAVQRINPITVGTVKSIILQLKNTTEEYSPEMFLLHYTPYKDKKDLRIESLLIEIKRLNNINDKTVAKTKMKKNYKKLSQEELDSLKELFKENGRGHKLSNTALADMFGVSPSSMGRILERMKIRFPTPHRHP